MDTQSAIELINVLWPIFLGLITLVVVLSKMYYAIEILQEKVKILFDFHNNRKDKNG